MVDPATAAALILGGVIGYAIKPDGKVVPISYNNLRESKPLFYKKVDIDTSVARTEPGVEFPYEGTIIYVDNPTTPTHAVKVKLDEPDRDFWTLTKLRKLKIPFYRFFIINEAGAGTLTIYVGRGLQVEPYEGVVDSAMSMTLNDLSNVSVGTPTDENIVLYDDASENWIKGVLTDIAIFASHKARHQDGGGDEITLAGLAGEPATLTTHKALTTGVHGVGAGAIVGTTLTQILTNKRLTSPKINEDVALTPTATELNYVDGVTSAIQTQLDAKVAKALFDAYTILAADTDNTPAAITLAASQLIGRKASGGIVALAKADVLTIINVTEGADVTGNNAPQAHKTSHQDGGTDEISVASLSGLLADDQHVLDAEVEPLARIWALALN